MKKPAALFLEQLDYSLLAAIASCCARWLQPGLVGCKASIQSCCCCCVESECMTDPPVGHVRALTSLERDMEKIESEFSPRSFCPMVVGPYITRYMRVRSASNSSFRFVKTKASNII